MLGSDRCGSIHLDWQGNHRAGAVSCIRWLMYLAGLIGEVPRCCTCLRFWARLMEEARGGGGAAVVAVSSHTSRGSASSNL